MIAADSGDHDAIADNCELSTVNLNLRNDGNVPLTNVRLASVTSSNPAVRVASALPAARRLARPRRDGTRIVQVLPRAGRHVVGVRRRAHVHGDRDLGSVDGDRSHLFTLTAERSTVAGPLIYGFETDLGGWSVNAGSVNRLAGGAPGSTGASLHFHTGTNNDCNGVVSPVIKPTGTSTMSMYVNYILESGSFDRANARVMDARTGEKFLLTPTGATYNTVNATELLCDNLGNLRGWSGSHASWLPANFDLSPYAGREIRIDVHESTDQSALGSQGFWMDLVTVSNATQINCDGQTETCAALPPEVSPEGDPVPLTIGKSGTDLVFAFSESASASTYNLYRGSLSSLAQGTYDHAQVAGLCGFTDGIVGDGSVTVTVPDASVAADAYLLSVARNAAGESKYGTKTGGAELPLALNSCP